MVVVGPEDPLVEGIYDYFQNRPELKHIAVIGPSAQGAELEGSKEFAKGFIFVLLWIYTVIYDSYGYGGVFVSFISSAQSTG